MANRLRFLLAILLLVTGAAAADPPGRVGRVSHVEGDVSFRAFDREGSTAAVVNWPVTGGNIVATAPYARAEVRIGSTAVRLDGATELEFTALDDERIGLRLVSGSVALRVRNREDAAELEVLTPQGRVLLADTGRYRFDVDSWRGTTLVVVHEGGARFDGPGTGAAVGAGQQAWVQGGEPGDARVASRDPLDEWSLARDRGDESPASARYVSQEMTGYDTLDAHGDWRASAEYGPVWYPRAVAPGWVPYQDGRWAWIEPWGWTWVDRSPWGFAPFHYGRWALIGGVWGWVPGRFVPRPVYAPALVAWVGRPGFSVAVSIGSVPAVGWFPLAPREVYYPVYRASPTYVRNINVTHVTNVTRIVEVDRHRPANVHYANRPHALTVVPAQAVSGGLPVRTAVVRGNDPARFATLPVASSGPDVARPPVRERRGPDADRRHDARPPVPAAAAPAAATPRTVPFPEPERQSEARSVRSAAALPSPTTIERRENPARPDPQAQRFEPRTMPVAPTNPARVEAPRAERPPAPQPRIETPTPRIETRTSAQPRLEMPQSRTERQPAPQPRPEMRAPQPRAQHGHDSQPRPEPGATPRPRMEASAARIEPPRAAQPRSEARGRQRDDERRGSRDGGR